MAWNDQHALYPYQQQAVDRMVQANTLLAYDMGVGKTPTTIAAIELLRTDGQISQTGTVVVPASLKYQWAREVEKFSDQRAVVIDGTAAQRMEQYATVRNAEPGYMVMSYDAMVRDWKHHRGLGDGFIVLDEATAIKSFKTKRTRHLKEQRERWPIRFCLTGTPIENGRAEELFSILEFVEPKLLGNFWRDFEPKYIRRNSAGWIEGYRNLDTLHRRIRKNTLRRSHHDPEVAAYLPKVVMPDPIRVRLDARTRRLVDYISTDILGDLDEIAAQVRDSFTYPQDDLYPNDLYPNTSPVDMRGRLMAKISVLRMLLDTPDAVRESARYFDQGDGGSKYASDIVKSQMGTLRATPKMDALEEYLKDFLDTDPSYKAVVFSSFVNPAAAICKRFGPTAVRYTGSMNAHQKDAAKQAFTNDPSVRLFVSTDAGGYGLDLPVANLLINYDQPWQAGLLAQRNARIRRASSTWGHVTVQDFVVADTIEERMVELLQHKIAVSEAIIDGIGVDKDGLLDRDDLDTLRDFLTDRNGWADAS